MKMHHQTFFCRLVCSLPLVLCGVVLQDEGTMTPSQDTLLPLSHGGSASGTALRSLCPAVGAPTLDPGAGVAPAGSRDGRQAPQPAWTITPHLVLLKAQPIFHFLKRWRKPGLFFFSFPSNSDRITDPSHEEAFSDEHFNGNQEEARDAASCRWELAAGGRRFGCQLLAGKTPRWAVLWSVLPARQPARSRWEGADGTVVTAQYEETKQDKISK